MTLNTAYNRYIDVLNSFHSWRLRSGALTGMFLAACAALFTGIMAQAAIYLPWTPVPVTGHTVAVFAGAALLGRWGGAAQLMYIAGGAAGLNWFAGQNGGLPALCGPTAGYLAGYALAAWVLGEVLQSSKTPRRFVRLQLLMAALNFGVVYPVGLAGLYMWTTSVKGSAPGIFELLNMGLFPFIPGDIVKIGITSTLIYQLLPKRR